MVSFERRVMSFSRWTEYVKLHQPGVRLTRTAEDVCDSCVRIDIQLARDDLSLKEREHLVLEKGMHLQAAIDQRRFMSGFIKQYINFIISDITANRNNVLIYDERGQGKSADALCSLRLLFHL
ncbi:unnamed protein product [Sphagnum troendelagicum]|uniref:Uncharacterized protein n=1 Tax=Sphagnum troendelagicum TaxID=128251 RepID=A0ABP0USZ0_9BRYO